MVEIDCRGYSYPYPVVQLKKTLKAYNENISVLVNDYDAKFSVLDFLAGENYRAEVRQVGCNWIIDVLRSSK